MKFSEFFKRVGENKPTIADKTEKQEGTEAVVPKKETGKNESWRQEVSFRWNRMTPLGRQNCLIDIVSADDLLDITKYTMKFSDELPEKYIKALAKRWDLL